MSNIKKFLASIKNSPKKMCFRCKKLKPKFVFEHEVCAECLDDELQVKTGCRFGEINCNHDDCKHVLN